VGTGEITLRGVQHNSSDHSEFQPFCRDDFPGLWWLTALMLICWTCQWRCCGRSCAACEDIAPCTFYHAPPCRKPLWNSTCMLFPHTSVRHSVDTPVGGTSSCLTPFRRTLTLFPSGLRAVCDCDGLGGSGCQHGQPMGAPGLSMFSLNTIMLVVYMQFCLLCAAVVYHPLSLWSRLSGDSAIDPWLWLPSTELCR
jgi:hypothetical protein